MSKKDLQKFGKRLKLLRIDRNLTQLELAEILDMSPNFIGMIERGERNTTVENVFKIARALNVKPSNLFEEL
ncbi:helix-turn-helix transcriptional regulator [bacterium]|nr:helix-turn-helix transcriptional regulator [bacterium]